MASILISEEDFRLIYRYFVESYTVVDHDSHRVLALGDEVWERLQKIGEKKRIKNLPVLPNDEIARTLQEMYDADPEDFLSRIGFDAQP